MNKHAGDMAHTARTLVTPPRCVKRSRQLYQGR
jgi:hypothetical protein